MSKGLRPEIIRSFHATPFSTPIISVVGGKGGVGKTTVAVNLAAAFTAAGLRVALVDSDVDAPNCAILLGLPLNEPAPVNITQPVFLPEKCTDCQACIQACRRHSLFRPGENTILLLGECNGCEACFLVCPAEAVHRGHRRAGMTYKTSAGELTVLTGVLDPGFEESAHVVKALKKQVFAIAEQFDVIVIDTSPGIHCTVIEALKGSARAIVVTEPTPLGSHDLDRILSLLDMFAVRRSIFINRADLPGSVQDIRKVADRHATPIETGLRMDDQLLDSTVRGIPVVQLYPQSQAARTFTGVARNLARECLP